MRDKDFTMKTTLLTPGVLTKLEGGENLRTDVVEGLFSRFPRVGERFNMVAEPIDKDKTYRLVSTSGVKEILGDVDGVIRFRTHYSVYLLEVKDGREKVLV